jgi:hypothetical protein
VSEHREVLSDERTADCIPQEPVDQVLGNRQGVRVRIDFLNFGHELLSLGLVQFPVAAKSAERSHSFAMANDLRESLHRVVNQTVRPSGLLNFALQKGLSLPELPTWRVILLIGIM